MPSANRCAACQQRDIEGAAKIVENDKKLDALEVETERRAVQLIALRAPMAGDLRDVVAALKISGVVERIGDYAKNIAKRVPLLENVGTDRAAFAAAGDGADRHRDGARRPRQRSSSATPRPRCGSCERDDAVDDFYNSIFRTLLTLHDGEPAEHRPVDALVVRRQESRAGRRSRHQHRRDGLLCRDRPST